MKINTEEGKTFGSATSLMLNVLFAVIARSAPKESLRGSDEAISP